MKIIIIIIILIIIIISITIQNNNKNKIIKLKYYRCDEKKLGHIINDIFNNYNIIKDNNDWDIYIPCGYNMVESELLKIKINNNKNYYIFGINGCDSIVSKNSLWTIIEKKYNRSKAKILLPETYVLYNRKDITLLKNNYKPNDIYILKKNVQRKEGLKLTNSIYDILNGLNNNYKIAQKYIRDLYLINGYKVNLRLYLLIVIYNNQKEFYLSNIGKCIYTSKKYNDKELDFETNITSYNLDMNIYNMNPRTLNELRNYIYKDNKDANKLFNNIKRNMYYICKGLSDSVYQSNNINKLNIKSFQLFGIDIIFDKYLNPYLLEINKGPDMIPRDHIDYKLKYLTQLHMLNIVGILKNVKNNNYTLIYKK